MEDQLGAAQEATAALEAQLGAAQEVNSISAKLLQEKRDENRQLQAKYSKQADLLKDLQRIQTATNNRTATGSRGSRNGGSRRGRVTSRRK
ncbi:MAG: hypothetical protein P0S95_03980 [Rhabdochlamydiaceae bacterium]|nr:hypothetical protein [Candidatus Amphrikana amoebophyrae]